MIAPVAMKELTLNFVTTCPLAPPIRAPTKHVTSTAIHMGGSADIFATIRVARAVLTPHHERSERTTAMTDCSIRRIAGERPAAQVDPTTGRHVFIRAAAELPQGRRNLP